MAFKFTNAARYHYRRGMFTLGADGETEVGIATERHLITIAGAGSGKGAALIVPNLEDCWKGSAVVVDPKGENAMLTAEDRAKMGQTVGILDPYHVVKGDAERFRVSINPLAVLDPKSRSYRKDVEAFADGTIMRHDPKHETWVKAARTMIGGGIDLMQSEDGPPEDKTLPALRRMFLQPPEILREWAESMLAADTSARLAPEAGALLLDKLDNPESVPAQTYGSNLLPALGWIGDPAFDEVWHGLPPFDLRKLKEGNATLYLVLPPDALGPRGTFLRLFVSMALKVMMSDLAQKEDARCLFILDEFYSLGSLDIVAQAMGLMRGYGVQLWPFLQDLGQLRKLYGDDLMGTFFGNADAHIFFGNTDAPTLEYISQRIGDLTPNEVYENAPQYKKPFWNDAEAQRNSEFDFQNEQRRYEHDMRNAGRRRLTPDQIRELVGKGDGDKVARSMIVLAKGGDVLNLRLVPWFAETFPKRPAAASADPSSAASTSAATSKEDKKEKSGNWDQLSDPKELLAAAAILVPICWLLRVDTLTAFGITIAALLGKAILGFRFFPEDGSPSIFHKILGSDIARPVVQFALAVVASAAFFYLLTLV